MVGGKFTVFSLFGFVFEGTVFKYKSPGDHIRRGHLTDGFLRYGDLYSVIFGGAYTWSFVILRYSVAFIFFGCTMYDHDYTL